MSVNIGRNLVYFLLDGVVGLLVFVLISLVNLVESVQKLLEFGVDIELIRRIAVVFVLSGKEKQVVQYICEAFLIFEIEPVNRRLRVEGLENFFVRVSCIRVIKRIHKIDDNALAGLAFVIDRFVHDRRRQQHEVTHSDVVRNTLDKVRSIGR